MAAKPKSDTKKRNVIEVGVFTDLKIPNCEVVGALSSFKEIKRAAKGKFVGTVTVIIPDEWAQEMLTHVVTNSPHYPRDRVFSKHNYVLMRLPIGQKTK